MHASNPDQSDDQTSPDFTGTDYGRPAVEIKRQAEDPRQTLETLSDLLLLVLILDGDDKFPMVAKWVFPSPAP